MSNTSATGGYLVPSGAAPFYDDAFEDFMQAVFAGITGLPGDLVRPRWQPEPANLPAFGTDWLAFGFRQFDSDAFAFSQHVSAGDGSDVLSRWESVTTALSMYGPNASGLMAQLRDGLQIDQNRAVMNHVGVKVQETSDIIAAPTLTKDRWYKRFDMTLVLRRQVDRTYPILNLLSMQGTIQTETFSNPIIVTE